MTSYSPICQRTNVTLVEETIIEVCVECWHTYMTIRKEVMDVVFCKGSIGWQRKILSKETI